MSTVPESGVPKPKTMAMISRVARRNLRIGDTIKYARVLYLSGMTVEEVKDQLNMEGHRTVRGQEFTWYNTYRVINSKSH